MKDYLTKNIINFALIGHSTTGKTTLIEAMAYNAGLIQRMGTIEDGSTVSDYHDYEIERGQSISSTLVNLEWLDKKLNILDTPGSLEFQGEAKAALRVVDFAAIVVSATNGIEVGTELSWEYCTKDYQLPRIIIVNLADRENADIDMVLGQIKERFGNKAVPLTLPINHGEGFNQVADVMRKEVYTFQTDGSGNYSESSPSGEWAEKLNDLHAELIEVIAESDDTLLEKFFENDSLTEEELRGGIHGALLAGNLIPIFVVSSKNNIGVKRFMDIIARYAPCAADFSEVTGVKPGTDEEIKQPVSEGAPASAFVFKTVSESHIGEMSFFRVYSGVVNSGDELKNVNRNSTERMRQIYYINGKDRKDASKLIAGDIGAALKLKNTHTGDTLTDPKGALELPPILFPQSNIRMAITPKSRGDEDKMSEGLALLHEEDPTFSFNFDGEIKQTVITGQGELHFDIILKKLKARFGVELEMFPPKVPYRETITTKAEAKYRHKKQSGGAGQFAEVWMRIEPKSRGEGVEFTNSLVGQNVDRTFVPSVEKGVNAACNDGIIAGCRVVDLKVDFYDGKMHPVDSNDMSFQIAGKHAFKDCFMAAKPKLLEPIYTLKAKIPETSMGDVMGDISQRRGKVLGMDSDGHFQIISAEVPLANLHDYSTSLRSITQGRGMFTLEFSHYEDLPHTETEKVIAAYQKAREEGNK